MKFITNILFFFFLLCGNIISAQNLNYKPMNTEHSIPRTSKDTVIIDICMPASFQVVNVQTNNGEKFLYKKDENGLKVYRCKIMYNKFSNIRSIYINVSGYPQLITDKFKLKEKGYFKYLVSSPISTSEELASRLAGNKTGYFIDKRDNTEYKWVQIGEQVWMAENLKATLYPNGDTILFVESQNEWEKLECKDAACNFLNNPTKSGVLYTFNAAIAREWKNDNNDFQGVCPDGWHLPSDEEWKTLEQFLGISKTDTDVLGYRGTNQGSQLASSTNWSNSNESPLLNNDNIGKSKFDAIPGGFRFSISFFGTYTQARWWTSTFSPDNEVYGRQINVGSSAINRFSESPYKPYAFNVRCIKGPAIPEPYDEQMIDFITTSEDIRIKEQKKKEEKEKAKLFLSKIDSIVNSKIQTGDFVDKRDNNKYKWVKIGDQTWMAENLRYTNKDIFLTYMEKYSGWENSSQTGEFNCWCYPKNEESNADLGILYQWEAADMVCPEGWDLPTIEDWQKLKKEITNRDKYFVYEGDLDKRYKYSANNLKKESKIKLFIDGYYLYPEKINLFKFSAIKTGNRYSKGKFSGNSSIYWWSKTEADSTHSYRYGMFLNDMSPTKKINNKGIGYPVRCIKKDHKNVVGSTFSKTKKETKTIETTHNSSNNNKNTTSKNTLKTYNTTKANNLDNTNNFIKKPNTKESAIETKQTESKDSYTTLTDIDGNQYKCIKFGKQTWMAENLRVTHYANGKNIPKITDPNKWSELKDNNIDAAYSENSKSKIYGFWYTFAAAIGINESVDIKTNQGICPNGWHIPSENDWEELIQYINYKNGFNENLDKDVKKNIVSKSVKSISSEKYWNSSSNQLNIGYLPHKRNNKTGFSAIPAGRISLSGEFKDENISGFWWASNEFSKKSSNVFQLSNYDSESSIIFYKKSQGFNVRCIKN